MEAKLEKQVRFLRTYAVVATLFCAIFLLSAFVIQNKRQKFEEIDVERGLPQKSDVALGSGQYHLR